MPTAEPPVRPDVSTERVKEIARSERYEITDEEAQRLASLSEAEIRQQIKQWKSAQSLLDGPSS